jgi:hypothetical protein
MVTWELSTAEVSNTEGVYGEAERWRAVVVLVVDIEEGGDLSGQVNTRNNNTGHKIEGKERHTSALGAAC